MWLFAVLASCPGPFVDERASFAQGQPVGFGLTDAGLVVRSDAGPAQLARPAPLTGAFISRVFDFGAPVRPLGVTLSTLAPSGGLPSDGGADQPFSLGALSMQENVLLVPFDEPGGSSTVRDHSSHGFVGRPDAGVTFGVPGVVGSAARFDGGCVFFDSRPEFDPTQTLTIVAWIRPTNLNGVDPHGIVSRRIDYQNESQFTFFLWLGDQLYVDLETEDDRFSGSTVIQSDVWTHVAMVYDGRLGANVRARIYVNGQLDAESPETSSSLSPRALPLVVGCLPSPAGGTVQAFEGDLDEVAVFRRALTSSDISSVYARGASQHRVDYRPCIEPTCRDAGSFVPTTSPLPETRFLQYRLESDAPANLLEWSTVTKVDLLVGCPDAGATDASVGDAGVRDAGAMDAGGGDAGTDAGPDAGAETRSDAGVAQGPDAGELKREFAVGCGCSNPTGRVGWWLVSLLLLARAPRRSP